MTDSRSFEASPDSSSTALRLPKVVLPQPVKASVASYTPPWGRITVQALIMWAITRVAYVALDAIALRLPHTHAAQGPGFLGVWERFDTNWYIGIATVGYQRPPQIAFFPVYPALTSIASVLLGGNMLVAALVVANLGSLLALIAVGGLAAWEMRDARASTYAILAVLIYPFSFFLAAAYTEGLFLAFTALCLLFARQGRWRLAAVMALLAGATRPTGVALAPALAWEWLRQRGLLQPEQWRAFLGPQRVATAREWIRTLTVTARRDWAGIFAIAVVPAFIVGLAIFSWLRFGHPSLIITVRRDYWGLTGGPIWQTVYLEVLHAIQAPLGSGRQITMGLDSLALAAAAWVTITHWRRYPFAYALYTASLLYLCVAERTMSGYQILQGPGRYLVGAVPMLLALGELLERRPKLAAVLICLGLVIQCWIALNFLTGTLVE